MNKNYSVVIERLETIVAELECEFLYLLNDMYADADAQAGQVQSLVSHLRLARSYLSNAAAETHRSLAVTAH